MSFNLGTENTLPLSILSAVAPFMGKKDVRFYLNGAYVAASLSGLECVATDGHRLAAFTLPGSWNLGAMIIPRETVEALLKAKVDAVTFTRGEDHWVTARAGDVSLNFRAIDGKFPDWRVVSSGAGGEHGSCAFDADVFDAVGKSCKALAKAGFMKKPVFVVTRTGESRAMFAQPASLPDGVAGRYVVMPYKAGNFEQAEMDPRA